MCEVNIVRIRANYMAGSLKYILLRRISYQLSGSELRKMLYKKDHIGITILPI